MCYKAKQISVHKNFDVFEYFSWENNDIFPTLKMNQDIKTWDAQINGITINFLEKLHVKIELFPFSIWYGNKMNQYSTLCSGACETKHKLILALFCTCVGYVQGMSDLLSPVLVVMENEVDAFWCFAGLMERVVSIWRSFIVADS